MPCCGRPCGRGLLPPARPASTDSLLPDELLISYRAWDAPEFEVLALRAPPSGLPQQAIDTLEARYQNKLVAIDLGRGIGLAVLCDYKFLASALLNMTSSGIRSSFSVL